MSPEKDLREGNFWKSSPSRALPTKLFTSASPLRGAAGRSIATTLAITISVLLLPRLVFAAAADSGIVDGAQSWWVNIIKEVGTPVATLAAFMWIAVKHLIPAWERSSERRDAWIQKHNEQLWTLLENQRVDRQRDWDLWRQSISEVTESIDRMCALIIAHDSRTVKSSNPKELLDKATELSGIPMEKKS